MSTVHCYPVRDLIEHETDGDDCPCGPALEAVPADDGSMGWLVMHHSLDGREFVESARLSADVQRGTQDHHTEDQ